METVPRLVGSNKETARILLDVKAKDEGRTRLITTFHDVINPVLANHNIKSILPKQFEHINNCINDVETGAQIDLFKFVREELTSATMNTFYGPHNPMAVHPDLIHKYWDWDHGLIGYMVGILPKMTARKAYYGAEAVANGFYEYMEQGLLKEALPFLQVRKKMHDDVGISLREYSRLEIGLIFGFISNASISSFWVVNNICSRPDLLKEVREEIFANAYDAKSNFILPSKLKDACPLFNSVFRETLRLIAPMTSARFILEDTILADTYLLRKGNMIQIAGGVLHSDTDIWGPDASSFNARRFFHSTNGSKSRTDGSVPDSKADIAPTGAFRAFGGGAHYCPGRHFAQMEILSLSALLILGFDMQAPARLDNVQWDPPRDDKGFPIAVIKPLKDISVRLARRDGFEGMKLFLGD